MKTHSRNLAVALLILSGMGSVVRTATAQISTFSPETVKVNKRKTLQAMRETRSSNYVVLPAPYDFIADIAYGSEYIQQKVLKDTSVRVDKFPRFQRVRDGIIEQSRYCYNVLPCVNSLQTPKELWFFAGYARVKVVRYYTVITKHKKIVVCKTTPCRTPVIHQAPPCVEKPCLPLPVVDQSVVPQAHDSVHTETDHGEAIIYVGGKPCRPGGTTTHQPPHHPHQPGTPEILTPRNNYENYPGENGNGTHGHGPGPVPHGEQDAHG